MLDSLTRDDRMRLMKFVCSFAWADLEVQDEERDFVGRMVRKLDLSEEERQRVDGWLEVPPAPDEVDPAEIPARHRKLFLDTVREVIAADSVLAPDEQENLSLFEALLK